MDVNSDVDSSEKDNNELSPQHGLDLWSDESSLSEDEPKTVQTVTMRALVKKFIVIFGRALTIKFIFMMGLKRLKLMKVFDARNELFKTPVAVALISTSFLFLKWVFQRLKQFSSLLSTAESQGGDQHRKWARYLRHFEHFLAGCLASLSTRLLTGSEQNLLKVFLYMRAVCGAVFLLKHWLEAFLNYLLRKRRSEVENQQSNSQLANQ